MTTEKKTRTRKANSQTQELPANICDIIKTAAKSGVKTLKFGTLEIEYKCDEKKVEEKAIPVTHAVVPEYDFSQVTNDSQEGIPVSEDLKTYEKDMMLEDDFENLPLQDMETYEELIATGKLDEYGSPSAET